MESNRCPNAEDWAVFAAGAASEAEWRRRVRHLAECPTCRRHAALLALSEGNAFPPALLSPPPPLARPRGTLGQILLRSAAAALLLGAMAFALHRMNRAEPPGPPTAKEPSVALPERGAEPRPLPEWPKALKPRPAPSVVPPERPTFTPLPPGLVREDPPVPDPAPDPQPAPPPSRPAPPAPPPSPFLAQHRDTGIAEAIEITPAAGSLSVDYDTTAEALARATYVRPTQALRTREGGSFTLPDGSTVHLAREGEIAVSWSQTLLCYSIDLHRGEALVDLGAAPRTLHVGNGPLGVRFADSSGQIHLAAAEESLRATPLSATAEFLTPAGDGKTLGTRQTLVLHPDRDLLESGLPDPRLSSIFPTLEAAPPRPAPRPPAPPGALGPSAAESVRALPAESYRFRVSGRQLREGAWFPQGVLYSTIDDFAVVKRADGGQSHTRRGQRPWDDLGPLRQGTREERLVGLLRNSKAPHDQVETALTATRGEPQLRAADLQGRPCTVSQFSLDPAKIRTDVGALIDQAVQEGRMAKPDFIYWDTLEGTLEITCVKSNARVVRAMDRRRLSYSYNSVSGLLRRAYVLETVYDFFDHAKASLKLPPDILKEMDPAQK